MFAWAYYMKESSTSKNLSENKRKIQKIHLKISTPNPIKTTYGLILF